MAETHLTNKRRLAFQMLDHQAAFALRQALQDAHRLELAELATLRRKRSLDKLRGRPWEDGGLFQRKSRETRVANYAALLEALTV